jgi:nitrogen-specific signal transduction histidine kinase
MDNNPLIVSLIIIINTLIGLIITLSNPHRSQNRNFFGLTIVLNIWMFFVLLVMHTESAQTAAWLIKGASASSLGLPVQLKLLLSSIEHPDLPQRHLWKANRLFLLITLLVAIACAGPWFIHEVHMPSPEYPTLSVAEPVYGPAFPLFVFFFIGSLLYTLYKTARSLFKLTGVAQIELQYILLGGGIMLLSGSTVSLILPFWLKTTQVQQYGPLSVVLFILITAYGIATRRILDVSTLTRKVLAYALLTTYLSLLYLVVEKSSHFLLGLFLADPHTMAHIISTLAVAFSLAPVSGMFQTLANKLIISNGMDSPRVMKQATLIFQSISSVDSLLNRFSIMLHQALKTESIIILSPDLQSFRQQYPHAPKATLVQIANDSAVCQLINQTKAPICRQLLKRRRETPLTQSVLSALSSQKCELAVGIFTKEQLTGIVLFGSRSGGRIYDQTEQDTLQMLCNQLAIARENATLYTQMQESKIRNDILLNQLANGVIFADQERKITLINREARRLTGIEESRGIGESTALLPEPIYKLIEKTLTHHSDRLSTTCRREVSEEMAFTLRMTCSFLKGNTTYSQGALLVITDLTEVKRLEEQVRRTDQLSSVGTLAAGMAHEIKNPLVSINTFTQLLPERYEDPEFRELFSSLVCDEVKRIDDIVKQLLRFSKPIKPSLAPIHLHEVVAYSAQLAQESMKMKQILLSSELNARPDLILGDREQLIQPFLNFLLNAIDAIGEKGTILVRTENCKHIILHSDQPDQTDPVDCIKLDFSDTGAGIAPDKLSKIFDPFYTSKSNGTGMGLSVAHGIIREHRGIINVESKEGVGTTFSIYFPVTKK